MEASKKKMKFPSAFSILFIILLIAIGLTWLIPSGSYSKLSYDTTENHFIVKTHGIPDQSYPATEQTLNQLNIKIQLSNFTNGIIKKPIAIPDTYQRIEQHEKGITDMIHAMVDGTIEVADIMIFIFILGGMIGVINKTGAFNAGLMSLTKKTKGNEFSVVFAVCVLMLLGGTACGIEEEAVAFYPILVPVFLALGYDSIVCVADEEIVKIHVHTNDPGLAIQKALTYGSLTRMKIDNMREEHHERVIKNASEMAKQQKQEEKKVEFKENGFISVSVGDGLTDLFHELGVDEVIEGGQTMNPSTEDVLGAIEKIPAKNIYILPNNGNIILAAEQAKDLTKDKAVHVIPTKNIPQGIAAMINFVEGFTPEQNEEAMTEALSEVKSGQVTYAVRDTVIDGKEIKAGNIMGLSDKTIEVVGTDVVDTTIDLLKKMMDEESELITIYYGEEGTKEDAEKIAKAIEEIDDEMEVEIQYGGQPIYYYFVSIE